MLMEYRRWQGGEMGEWPKVQRTLKAKIIMCSNQVHIKNDGPKDLAAPDIKRGGFCCKPVTFGGKIGIHRGHMTSQNINARWTSKVPGRAAQWPDSSAEKSYLGGHAKSGSYMAIGLVQRTKGEPKEAPQGK